MQSKMPIEGPKTPYKPRMTDREGSGNPIDSLKVLPCIAGRPDGNIIPKTSP